MTLTVFIARRLLQNGYHEQDKRKNNGLHGWKLYQLYSLCIFSTDFFGNHWKLL